MDSPSKKLAQIKRWLSIISDIESLEAPQRAFIGHRDIITRNLSRYHFVAQHVFGAMLEVGCGRGYGLKVLGPQSRVQAGLDVSGKFLRDACQENPGAAFVCASGDALPLASDSFDSVIAFDVIEHTKDDLCFLAELKRVARRDAFIAISTPNRMISSGNRGSPLNPFHVREYLASEFHDLLKPSFRLVEVFGQFDQETKGLSRNGLLDRIPIRWKYLLPQNVQSLLSVAIRPPLRLEECRFQKNNLERAHTFVALCWT
jgi:SAM-dependent methyltransferase